MKRRLFTILSALSLLLFVAVVVLWVRSYVHIRYFATTPASGTSYQMASARGGVLLSASTTSGPRVLVHDHVTHSHFTLTGGRIEGTLATNRSYTFARYYYVPYLWLALLLVLLPVIQLKVMIARYGEPKPRLCPSCGYDLRATPERCPECGTEARDVGGVKSGREMP